MKKRLGDMPSVRVANIVTLTAFIAGTALGVLATLFIHSQQPVSKPKALRESDFPTARSEYRFIDPLISLKGVGPSEKYNPIEKQITSFIADHPELLVASVDFRDINEPGGFVVNPDEKYTAASLNKVPVMMAYFKIAETDPSIFSRELYYSGENDSNSVEEIKSAVQLTPGKRYTIEQLIEHMIRYSDNNAADLLTLNLKNANQLATYAAVFSDLGTDPKVLSAYTDNMTVQNYSMFLRALYNATYLNRTSSEAALTLLSQTDFTAGIESGVPNDVPVAQKFGEVRMTDELGTFLGKQIHNCGIVYYPEHPYLLCIMTKGKTGDISRLESDIAQISRIIYAGMEKLHP